MDGVVLVLNQNYEPLNVCNLPRAFRLVFGEKAEVIEFDHQEIRTPREAYPRAVGHPPPAPRPAAPPAGQADPARDLQPRPPHLPVLRPPVERPDPRPRRARAIAAAGTRGRTSSRRARVQPPQGRQDPRRGAPAPPARRRSSRAATSTRCSRRTSRTRATRPGGTTSSSAGTEAGRVTSPAERTSRPSIPAAVQALFGPAAGRRPRRPTSSAAASATPPRAAAGGLGPRHRRAARAASSSSSPSARYENAFGTVAVRRDRRSSRSRRSASDHDYADFRRPHRVEFGDQIEVDLARRDFTVNAHRLGRRARASAPRLVDPFDGRADIGAAASCAPSATRPSASTRTRCGCSGPPASRPSLDFTIEPATLAAIAAVGRARRAPVRRADRGRARQAPRRADGRRSACGSWPTTGLLAAIAPELAAQRGIAQNKIPGEDLWDHIVRSVDATAAAGRDRTVRWRPSSTTSASRSPPPTATSTATTSSAPSSPATSSAAGTRRARRSTT